MTELYETVELPLCAGAGRMEQRGFLVDGKALAAFGRDMADRIDRTWSSAFTISAGESSTSTPPSSWGRSCLKKWGCPTGKRPKPAGPPMPTCWRSWQDHPWWRTCWTYRQYAKLKSTYADGLLKVIDPMAASAPASR